MSKEPNKNVKKIVGIMIGCLILLGASYFVFTQLSSPKATSTLADKKINVIMNLVSVEQTGRTVKITLSTNLPDGMYLMAELRRNDSDWGQDQITVENGKAVTTFEEQVSGIRKLTITSPIVAVQPDNIKPLLGKGSENLTGNLVKFNSEFGDYSVEYITNIEVK